MKRFLSVLLVLVVCLSAFASMYHSVGLDSPAYRIIDWAEVRGIIAPQTDVRPYNLDVVRSLLSEIVASGELSAGEREEIAEILAGFDKLYGSSDSSSLNDIAVNGFYRTSSADKKTNSALGLMFADTTRVGTSKSDKLILDTRNKITAFFRGDFLGVVSYDMNISGQIDRINRNAFVFTDFYTEAEGAYMDYFSKGEKNVALTTTVADHLYAGLSATPEISASVKEGLFSARIGAINHDWGVGNGNFALSRTARNMDAVEFTIAPTSWINYSVMTASLGKFQFSQEENWPSEDWHNDLYDNNLALHRVEVGPFAGVKLAVWESCVYRKRFELSYINPFQIYLFAQNSLGDFDNVLVGADLSVTVKDIGTFYGALSVDEFNKPSKFFTCPRNMVALQAGFKGNIPVLDFSTVNAQVTYVPPFFGTHYGYNVSVNGSNPWGKNGYISSYVNKGQNLGYNLDPDSLELLVKAETSYCGFNFTAGIKDILRSYQYANDSKNGQNMLTTMIYNGYKSDVTEEGMYGYYYKKDFLHNIGENILDISASAEKKFADLPFDISLGFDLIFDSKRSITSMQQAAAKLDDGTVAVFNTGKSNEYGDWEHTLKVVGSVGVKIYY